jgi:hypothetical protein
VDAVQGRAVRDGREDVRRLWTYVTVVKKSDGCASRAVQKSGAMVDGVLETAVKSTHSSEEV